MTVAPGRLVRWLPWVLLGVSGVLVVVNLWLRWRTGANGDSAVVELLRAVLDSLAFFGFSLVGAVVAARLPGNPFGWLCAAAGLGFWLGDTVAALHAQGLLAPWPADLLERQSWVTVLGCLVLIILVFPTGRLPSARWRWLPPTVAGVLVLVLVAGILAPAAGPAASTSPWMLSGTPGKTAEGLVIGGSAVVVVLFFVVLGSLPVRYRRSGSVERLQLRWLALAALVLLSRPVVNLLVQEEPFAEFLDAAAFAAIPAAMGVAVLRYRLFEIDRLLSRTVSYALLTACLVGSYLLAVALLRPLLAPLAGTTDLAVAISTLAVAAVFQPLRKRLQTAVDRRFDRARYDAARTVEAYAARLRTQVDLEEVIAGLRDTVVTTVGPTRVGLWLSGARPQER